jgi:hypothetical protein
MGLLRLLLLLLLALLVRVPALLRCQELLACTLLEDHCMCAGYNRGYDHHGRKVL